MVCTHPLNRNWTDVPRDPLFVPLVKNLFATLQDVVPMPAQGPAARNGLSQAVEKLP